MVAGPDPDPDKHFYDIDISGQNQEFFNEILEAHKEVIREPPEGGDWLYSTLNPSLSNLGVPPETVEAILQVILDIWREEALGVDDTRFHQLITDMRIEAWDDDRVPDILME